MYHLCIKETPIDQTLTALDLQTVIRIMETDEDTFLYPVYLCDEANERCALGFVTEELYAALKYSNEELQAFADDTLFADSETFGFERKIGRFSVYAYRLEKWETPEPASYIRKDDATGNVSQEPSA